MATRRDGSARLALAERASAGGGGGRHQRKRLHPRCGRTALLALGTVTGVVVLSAAPALADNLGTIWAGITPASTIEAPSNNTVAGGINTLNPNSSTDSGSQSDASVVQYNGQYFMFYRADTGYWSGGWNSGGGYDPSQTTPTFGIAIATSTDANNWTFRGWAVEPSARAFYASASEPFGCGGAYAPSAIVDHYNNLLTLVYEAMPFDVQQGGGIGPACEPGADANHPHYIAIVHAQDTSGLNWAPGGGPIVGTAGQTSVHKLVTAPSTDVQVGTPQISYVKQTPSGGCDAPACDIQLSFHVQPPGQNVAIFRDMWYYQSSNGYTGLEQVPNPTTVYNNLGMLWSCWDTTSSSCTYYGASIGTPGPYGVNQTGGVGRASIVYSNPNYGGDGLWYIAAETFQLNAGCGPANGTVGGNTGELMMLGRALNPWGPFYFDAELQPYAQGYTTSSGNCGDDLPSLYPYNGSFRLVHSAPAGGPPTATDSRWDIRQENL